MLDDRSEAALAEMPAELGWAVDGVIKAEEICTAVNIDSIL